MSQCVFYISIYLGAVVQQKHRQKATEKAPLYIIATINWIRTVDPITYIDSNVFGSDTGEHRSKTWCGIISIQVVFLKDLQSLRWFKYQ